ncbi:hypothetical protein [Pseudomonas sp. NPDC096950]|uniref:hypothetical protein n=1 Tax=Pseudomonas sp. NPDC096950 TaxID=3364485 RepID=UPI00383B3F46
MLKVMLFCSAAVFLSGCQPKWIEQTPEDLRIGREFSKKLHAKDQEKLSYEEEMINTIFASRPPDVNLLNLMDKSLSRCLWLRSERGGMENCSRRSVPIVENYYFEHFYDGSKSPPPGYVAVSHAYLKWTSLMEVMQSAPNSEVVDERAAEAKSAIDFARF